MFSYNCPTTLDPLCNTTTPALYPPYPSSPFPLHHPGLACTYTDTPHFSSDAPTSTPALHHPELDSPSTDNTLQAAFDAVLYLEENLRSDSSFLQIGPQLIVDDYIYTKKAVLKGGLLAYRCNHFRASKTRCPAAIRVNAMKTTVIRGPLSPHNHPPTSSSTLDMLRAAENLNDDERNLPFEELALFHGVALEGSRKMRVRRNRRMSRQNTSGSV